MSIIYEPRGKAREYSPLSANLYSGCNHNCKYCYVPNIFGKSYDQSNIYPRREILRELEKDCKKFASTEKQVLLSFTTDPYNSLEKDLRITRDALKLFLKYQIPVSILTKSNSCLQDIDVFKKFPKDSLKVGMTLTFDNDKDSLDWESGASLPNERLDCLKTLKENNITTWASFEPVIIPSQSLVMIKKSLPFVDHYKVGKINNYQGLDKTIDWTNFLSNVVSILREAQKPFYIKKDLRESASAVKLYGNEVLADEFCSIAFKNDLLFA